MDPARYKAMDAQRFDPMRRTRSSSPSKIGISKLTMGQGLCVMSHLSTFSVRDTVGGIWPDHEVVILPLSGADSESAASASSSSTTSDASSNTRASSPALGDFVVVPPSNAQVHVHDRDDLVITRTIIRPNRTPAGIPVFSTPPSTSVPRSVSSNCAARPTTPSRVARPATPSRAARSAPSSRAVSPSRVAPFAPSSRIASPSPSRPSRPTSPVLQALNCFSTSSAFESNIGDVHAEWDAQPALQVIVTQTREQFEDDVAFKQIVETVYPAAAGRI